MALWAALDSLATSVAIGDFNGDGKLDLVTADIYASTVSVLIGDGGGGFTAPVTYAVGFYPDSVAVGDFNGDGKLDIAATNLFDNNVSVLIGDGSGAFTAAGSFGTGTYPDGVAVGDFDGFNGPDLAIVNQTTGDVSILLNNATNLSAAARTTLTVTAVNDAPTATTPVADYAATEQVALSLKNTGLSVGDVDGGAGSETLTLSVGEGTLSGAAGDSGATIGGNDTASFTVTGTIAQINAFLNTDGTSTLAYTDGSDTPSASTPLTLSINDGGNTGTGGAKTSSAATASIGITAINDVPSVMTSGTYAGTPGNAVTLTGISFADIDAQGGSEQVTFTVASGTLSATASNGITFTGSSTATATLIATGTLADLDSFISGNHLTFTGTTSTSLDIAIDDLGHTPAPSQTSSTSVAIVLDNPPTAPMDTDPATNAVTEGAIAGTSVGITAHSTDADAGDTVSYSLSTNPGGFFAIDGASGIVTVSAAGAAGLDYESAPGHAYTIAVDASDGQVATTQTFSIAVNNVAPSVPVDSDNAANAVVEGAAAGTTVGITAASTDINGPAVNYSLSNSAGGAFQIDAASGVVTVLDPSKIDYETAAGHALTVTAVASDGAGGISSQDFTISITDVAPSIPVDSDNAANAVAEGAAVGTTVGVTAASTDVNGPAVSYSLSDSAGGAFQIDATSGVVTVLDPSKINYDDSAPSHALTITAVASDGTQTSSHDFSIGVTDVPPGPPSIASIVDHGSHFDLLGTTKAHSDVTVSDTNAGVAAFTTTADGAGSYDDVSSSPLGDGSHALTAVATDTAGNSGVASPAAHTVIQTVSGIHVAFTDTDFTIGDDSALTDLILDGGGLTGTGNSHGNSIYSVEHTAADVNTLLGGSGSDLLVGGIGADHLQGGGGNDIYAVYNSNTQISDSAGFDLAYAYGVNYSLSDSDGVDALVTVGSGLTGIGHTSTATALYSVESSTADVNTLIGGSGNDTLVGGIGADHLQGGDGNDIYAVYNSATEITDSGGYDIAYAQGVNYQIADGSGVDGLVVFGSGLTGTGSSGDDALFSIGAHNTLNGGSGGSDSFIFDTANTANDIVTGFQAHGASSIADTIFLQHYSDASFDQAIADHHIFQSGNDVVIADATDTIATLQNIQLASLHASDFQIT